MLCLASLLHDSAMHLTEVGFLSLVHDASRQLVLPGDEPWLEIWMEFLSEASRFDGRKLTELFGSSEPIHRPDVDPAKWQPRDRLSFAIDKMVGSPPNRG